MDSKNLDLHQALPSPVDVDMIGMDFDAESGAENNSLFDYNSDITTTNRSFHSTLSSPKTVKVSDRNKFDGLDSFDLNSALASRLELENEFKLDDEKDSFAQFEQWLLDNGAEFPDLYLKSYSPDVRGVHAKKIIEGYQTVLLIPLRLIITDYMGRTQTEIGRQVFSSNANFSTPNLIAVIIYILVTRRDPNHFFQPYYKILPKSYSNFPIFWTPDKLAWLEGSPLVEDIEERKRNMQSDYDELIRVCPDFQMFSFDEFLEVRTAVGSRNFGIAVNGEKRTAMVPYADMLNHFRPRETSWTYENSKGAFTITSMTPLQPGQQVMDSYGKKCNSKFFLHYGFAVERNREDDGKCQNEVLLNLTFDRDAIHFGQFEDDQFVYDSGETNDRRLMFLSTLFNANIVAGSSVTKEFRISMNIEDRATMEGLGFLRTVVATSAELEKLIQDQRSSSRHIPDLYFARLRDVSILPLSFINEARALDLLASYCEEQLRRYSLSYADNLKLLNSPLAPPFSDRRTAFVVVIGEQEILHFWQHLAHVIGPILRRPDVADIFRGLNSLDRLSDRDRDVFRYAMHLKERFQHSVSPTTPIQQIYIHQ